LLLEDLKTDARELSEDASRGSHCLSKVDTLKGFLDDIALGKLVSKGHEVGSVDRNNKTKGLCSVLGHLRGKNSDNLTRVLYWVLGNLEGRPQKAVVM
jgi:hypothetical protein